MLEIKDLHVSYGGIQALRGVSLNVPDGKIVTLIGANGAGKSTLMRTISGLVKAQSGPPATWQCHWPQSEDRRIPAQG